MSQLKEILEIENNRTEDNRSTIYLFQEGSFYRAYEWSAWLCHRYLNQFKVTHRNFRQIEQSVMFVGFPVTSFAKYSSKSDAVLDVSEKCKTIIVSSESIPVDMTLEMMWADFENWKGTIPIQEPSKKSNEVKAPFDSRENGGASINVTPSRAGIVQKILAFPLENKTPMECMSFVAKLKQMVVSIIGNSGFSVNDDLCPSGHVKKNH